MNIGTVIVGGSVILVVIVVGLIVLRRRPRNFRTDKFMTSWRELQGYCRDKATWPLAVIEADKLLDKALKMKKLKGKTMGERLVAGQRLFSDNDDVWFAHNLAKKLLNKENASKLKEVDVKDALIGVRTALKDIGALPGNESNNNGR